MKWILLFLPCFLYCLGPNPEVESPKIKASYEPWYTGPLLTTTATNEPVGFCYVAPLVFGNNFYGIYDNHWERQNISNLYQLNYVYDMQFGLVRDFIDAEIVAQAFTSFFHGKKKTTWGDTSAGIGINLSKDNLK